MAKSFSKKSDALAWACRKEAEMESGRWLPEEQEVPTLCTAIGEYRTTVAVGMKGADSSGTATLCLKHWGTIVAVGRGSRA